MAVERTLVLIKPDAVERGLAGEILRRFEARGLAMRAGQAADGRPRAGRAALRRARREAVLRRARRVHHLGADARARARGRGGDRGRPLDDGLDEPGRLGAGDDPRRPRALDAGQPRARLRLAGVGRARDRAVVRRWRCSSDAAHNRADLGPPAATSTRRGTPSSSGGRTSRAGGCGSCRTRSSGSSATSRARTCSSSAAARRSGRSCSPRRGARVVGLDNSARQLEHARELMAAAGVDFPLVHAQRRGGAAAGRELRRRLLRPRRDDLRRPVPDGARRRRGCCGRAGCSRSRTRRRSRCAASTTRPRRWQRRLVTPYFGMHRFDELPDEPVEFNLPVRRVDPALPRERLPRRGAGRGAAAGGRGVDLPHAPRRRSGRARGRWRRSGDAGRGLTEHAAGNREAGRREAASYVAGAERNWAADEITWGILDVPESEVGLLGDVAGKDVVELGCGTAYVSAWLARRGARVGRRRPDRGAARRRRGAMQAEHGLEFPLVHASAEDVPLPDASFDLAVSEYGASIWCDPDLWIAEAARLLRPGGELVFLVNGTFADADLARRRAGRAGRHRAAAARTSGCAGSSGWTTTSIDFHLGYGDWIRVLTSHGFEVERLVELRNPGHDAGRYDLFTAEWAERWPAEEMWKARKVGVSVRRRRRCSSPRPRRSAARSSSSSGSRSTSSRPRYEEHDPPDADPVELVRAHAQGKARSVADEAGDRPGARRRHDGRLRRPRLRQGGEAGGGGGDARRARRRDARGRLGPLPAHARLGGAAHGDDARHVPPADRPRHRRVRRVRRVGGPRRRLRDPGPRRRASSSGSRATT